MGSFVRCSGLVCALVLAMSGTTGAAGATTPTTESTETDQLLDRPAHGTTAINLLGDQLPEAAALNEVSAPELKSLLRTDTTVWVDPEGRLFNIDPAPGSTAVAPPSPAAPYAYADTFALHSKPGSPRVIYLDFDGHAVSGTAWNNAPYNVGTALQPAFDTDGTPATFGTSERDVVQDVWQRVSEDYAPFDVDVTTQDPGVEAIRRTSSADLAFGTRALITPSTSAAVAICGGGCGGVAYVGTFDLVGYGDAYQPAWVFSQGLGPNNAKFIADAVSHEVGHNLGLSHDTQASGGGYYPGHGAWGPIMGGPYNYPVTQWSNGDYAAGGNDENDFAVIAANGLAPRGDDHGDTTGTATPMTDGTPLTAAGVITSRTDRDYLSLTHGCPGTVTVSASPAATGPNLDMKLTLLTADGGLVASNDPQSATTSYRSATGLSASVSADLGTGTYFVEVDGVGALEPTSTGYSDYGSVGDYTVTATACGTESPPPPPPPTSTPGAPTSVNATGGNTTATVNWAAPTDEGSSAITGYLVRRFAGTGSTPQLSTTVSPAVRRFDATGLTNGTAYTFDVTALNTSGPGTPSTRSGTVVPATVPGLPRIGTASSGAAGGAITAKATWLSPLSTGGSPITGYRVTALRMSTTGAVLSTTVSAVRPGTSTSYSMSLARAGSYRFTVVAQNSAGVGAASSRSNLVTGR